MPVSALRITEVGPFDEAQFELDPHLNVFVGPNNCGKTTVLLTLAEILIFPFEIPAKFLRGRSRFSIDLSARSGVLTLEGQLPIQPSGIGNWTKEQVAALQDKVRPLGFGTFVPAVRLSTDFRSAGPLRERERQIAPTMARAGGEEQGEQTPLWTLDKRVIQQMIELDYRAYRENKPAIRELLGTIAQLASEVTEGFSITFEGIGEDKGGLFPQFRTPDGVVPLNVLSQGTQSLIQWCAQLVIGYANHYSFPKSLKDKPGVLLVDEIDAHLHPSWQRRILPAISSRFPSLQVFCAAHSPMTLAGLKAGQVQLLTRDAKGHIQMSRNERDVQGWSADEIYSSFFGVEPTDLETAEKLDRLRSLRGKSRLTPGEKRELNSLRDDLRFRMTTGPAADQAGLFAAELKEAARATGRRPARKRAANLR